MGQAGKERRKQEAQEPKAKLSHRDKLVADVESAAKRLSRLAKKLAKLPPDNGFAVGQHDGSAQSGVEAIVRAFDGLVTRVAALPEDWKPGRAKRGSSWVIDVGDVVQIREKHVALYADVIDKGADLTVTNVHVSLIAVQPPAGEQLHIPRGHLQPKSA